MKEIYEQLCLQRDEKYAQFHRGLVPNVEADYIIGVRTPILRKFAKELSKSPACNEFLNELPHDYFEENQLQAFVISEMKDFDYCMERLEQFLPYINNWATCDQTSPKIFKKNKDLLLPSIYRWIDSEHTYTIRFAIGMLMQHFLEEDFKEEYVELVSSVQSDEYYVNMEIAWYMATALAKQWDATIPYIEEKKMGRFVHNKTIQKARESYRITPEQKEYLKGLKIAR